MRRIYIAAGAVSAALLLLATRQPAEAQSMFPSSSQTPLNPIEQMISPVSVPTLNEDPRVTTELRPMFMYHSIANSFVTDGGNYSVIAVQARAAITDRIGFIATKDGYIFLDPNEVVPKADGWANIAFGFKGILYQDIPSGFIVTGGLRWESPWGKQKVLQGKGKGVLNPFLSVAKAFGDFHLQGYTGPRIPIDGADSTFYDFSLHADYRFGWFYPLAEFNLIHVIDGGRRLPINQEGFDLVNLGSTEAGGQTVGTVALGWRFRITDDIDWGATGEFPVTPDKDIFGWRVTTDFIWRPVGWGSFF